MQVELLKKNLILIFFFFFDWKFIYLDKKSSEEKRKIEWIFTLIYTFSWVGIWTSSCLFMLLLLTWLLIRCLLYGVRKVQNWKGFNEVCINNSKKIPVNFVLLCNHAKKMCFTMRRSAAQCSYFYLSELGGFKIIFSC